MNRREFTAHFVATAAFATCPAYAQKGVLPVVGYLGFDTAGKSAELLDAFRDGLRTLGFVENQNVAIEYRFAEGKYDRFPELVASLVQISVQVIVAATGTNGVHSITCRGTITFRSPRSCRPTVTRDRAPCRRASN